MQIAAAILFFYVFGLAAVLMTWYIVRTIKELIQLGREQRSGKRPSPAPDDEPIKLHISEGLIEVNRLPDEQ